MNHLMLPRPMLHDDTTVNPIAWSTRFATQKQIKLYRLPGMLQRSTRTWAVCAISFVPKQSSGAFRGSQAQAPSPLKAPTAIKVCVGGEQFYNTPRRLLTCTYSFSTSLPFLPVQSPSELQIGSQLPAVARHEVRGTPACSAPPRKHDILLVAELTINDAQVRPAAQTIAESRLDLQLHRLRNP
jgi:hypothetical protein